MQTFVRTLVAGLLLCLAASAFAHPGASIHVAVDGRVFFVDTGGGVFVVGRDGKRVKQPGPAFHWFALDEASGLAKTRWPAIPGAEITAVGTRPTVVLSSDFPVAVGADGALYYPRLRGGTQFELVRVAPAGTLTVHARFPAMKRSDGDFQYVNGLAATPDGALYFTHDRSVHRIDAKGRVTTIARDVVVPGCARIPGVEPQVGPYLRGLDVAPNGTVFVAAAGCGAVLMISPKGVVTPVLRATPPYSPTAVAVAKGEVFVLEYLHTVGDDRTQWLPRVRKITTQGTVELVVRGTR
ncbi:hypothetical protein LF41_2999 [Lysobacter dokdonensis DS-58]|uniref:SMP-30/Gluconolactonase/LRE-like region domain-containing protein n=1 Tax=Lysobacter dokdonensis DS-58 TaxID=1300345 RepID=A0A0A2X281_9GAMM|nr:hypothetical protein [Lysobacter dokdonensis]KGQ19349.1 hypothetical protein LF41_2999 [Lysobacter dokdonensis DS-58]